MQISRNIDYARILKLLNNLEIISEKDETHVSSNLSNNKPSV